MPPAAVADPTSRPRLPPGQLQMQDLHARICKKHDAHEVDCPAATWLLRRRKQVTPAHALLPYHSAHGQLLFDQLYVQNELPALRRLADIVQRCRVVVPT